MKTKLFTLALLVVLGSTLSAQKLIPADKSKTYLEFLKGQEKILCKYVYDDMGVGKKTEADYVSEKKKSLNEKEPGRGDKWENMWVEDRENRFEPKFESLFNKVLEKKGVIAGSSILDAEYTMTIKTTWTEPGYYVGVSSRPAFISGKIIFTKTGSEEVLAEIEFIKAPGNSMGATWDTGERIKESYAKLGKTLAAYLTKKAF
jgi:hypothetical protein